MNLHGNNDTGGSDLSGNGTYSHAYIIRGGSESERVEYAEKLASAIVCTGNVNGKRPCLSCIHCEKSSRHVHPDIIAIDRNPDTRIIYVDQIRALREDAVIMPNEASTKVYVINHAGAMNVFAQNAILKLLEEPPDSANFILLTENPAELLPTIRSRCVERSAERHDLTEIIQTRDDAAAFYQALTGNPLKLAGFTFLLEKFEKNEFIDFIDDAKAYIVSKLRDRHRGEKTALTSEYLMKVICVLAQAKEYVKYNVSLGHINGMICAELIRNEERND